MNIIINYFRKLEGITLIQSHGPGMCDLIFYSTLYNLRTKFFE